VYHGRNTDMLAALQLAVTEINRYKKHNQTVIGE
jgi:hypothetical protein